MNSTVKQQILVATRNQGKVLEYADMLTEYKLDWAGLDDLRIALEVEETGATFAENADLKAQQYALAGRCPTLADDSGLEVDALDGAPGVYTARYGGKHLTAVDRYNLLLKNLHAVSENERSARFRCVISIADADGHLLGNAEGVCEGIIATEPAGGGGFGYDPVFWLPEMGKTMAQLSPREKQEISHRGRALRAVAPLLRQFLS